MATYDECVYVGADWLIYAGRPGAFERSEFIAPGLVLGTSPGVEVTADAGMRVTGCCVLHRSGLWSRARASSLTVLYVDPLDTTGAALQRYVRDIEAWPGTVAPPLFQAPTSDALFDGSAATAVSNWVGDVKVALQNALPPVPALDARLRQVGARLAAQGEGRVVMAQLAAAVHWSPDHLRQCFRDRVGMTLSRYLMWRRLHSIAAYACDVERERDPIRVDDLVHAAGFHDRSHASRAIRRYFGLTSGEMAPPGQKFVDCRGCV